MRTPVLRFLLDAVGRRKAAVLLGLSATMSVVDLFGIAVIFPYLEAVTQPNARVSHVMIAWFPDLDRTGHILILSLVIILLYAAKNLMQALLFRYQFREMARLTEKVTNDVVLRMLQARYAMFQQTPVSSLASVAHNYTLHVTMSFQAFIQALNDALFLGLLLLGFLVIQPALALSLLGVLAVVAAVIYFGLIRRTTGLGRQQTQVESMRYRLLFSIITAIRDIKIMGLERLFDARNREISSSYAAVAWRYNLFGALPRLFIEFMVLSGAVIFTASYVLFNTSIEAIAPTLGVAVIAALRTVPSFSRLAGAIHNYRFSEPIVERLTKARDDLTAAAQTLRRDDELHFEHAIELRGIAFQYGNAQTLRNINMLVRRGQSVGIVGPSGCGKTTLLDLITGLQPAACGEFLCDGQRFDPFTSRSMQNLIGYVSQSITLLDDTIAFNVSFEHRPDPERLRRAIRIANLEQFVASLPEGVETQVGENGVRLSGGQRQRVGIARAIYREPAILVFDEATSSLDIIAERELTAEIAQLRGGITKVIVTHRLSTIVDCDHIYVLSRGAVVDSGTHRELLTRCELYRRLSDEEKMPVLQNAIA